VNKRILYKAINGQEFMIDTNELGLNSMEEVLDYITKLRKEHNLESPALMIASGNTATDFNSDMGELPESLKRVVEETKPYNKQLN